MMRGAGNLICAYMVVVLYTTLLLLLLVVVHELSLCIIFGPAECAAESLRARFYCVPAGFQQQYPLLPANILFLHTEAIYQELDDALFYMQQK